VKRIVVPAVATVLMIVTLLVTYGWNRSGEPTIRLTLTERELPLSWTGPEAERSARFRIAQQGRYDPLDARNWLTEDRLRALGFEFDVMPGAPEAATAYTRALPRAAWVALEYDGPSWREIERQRALTEPSRHPGSAYEPSRLVAVDASANGDALMARYPSGHLIIRASIQLGYRDANNKGPILFGYIRHLIPEYLSVPHHLRHLLVNLPDRDNALTPRYEVDVAVGRLGLPYVTDVRRR
jgi:hypothetical protein